MADYDDDYDAAAAEAAAAHRGGGGMDEDDELVLQASDKPGFAAWREALSTRILATDKRASWGVWDPSQCAVQLTRQRGKKMQVMGHTRRGARYLSVVEALFLLDDGALQLESSPRSVQVDAVVVSDAPLCDEEDDAPPGFMPFESAYSLLLSHTCVASYLVYCHLRALGLVVLMHAEGGAVRGDGSHLVTEEVVETDASLLTSANSGAATNGCSVTWPRVGGVTTRREQALHVAYDVYTRDGISSFRPSAPGPPDFYIVLTEPSAPPPSPTQLENLQHRMRRHMAALAQEQQARTAGGTAASATAHVHAALAPTEPVIKFAIVQHTAITFYGVSEAVLRLP